jgi:hypothetical protein
MAIVHAGKSNHGMNTGCRALCTYRAAAYTEDLEVNRTMGRVVFVTVLDL